MILNCIHVFINNGMNEMYDESDIISVKSYFNLHAHVVMKSLNLIQILLLILRDISDTIV